jgi:hypothetical protein
MKVFKIPSMHRVACEAARRSVVTVPCSWLHKQAGHDTPVLSTSSPRIKCQYSRVCLPPQLPQSTATTRCDDDASLLHRGRKREKHYVGNTGVTSVHYIQCGKIGYLSYNFALLNYIKEHEILQKTRKYNSMWTPWYAIHGTKRVTLTLPLLQWNTNGRASSHDMQEERNFAFMSLEDRDN